ncbi:sugar transporter ERD6-like 7 [Salvia divinorum]|uniref:Sugar transporter ERD6-like 7 n=2 Tax=Salvia divinorum TaxID=28513 RepID=A0ABD1H8B7_SALDI
MVTLLPIYYKDIEEATIPMDKAMILGDPPILDHTNDVVASNEEKELQRELCFLTCANIHNKSRKKTSSSEFWIRCFLGSLLLGSSLYVKEHGVASEAAPALALSGVMVIGMGAIPWVLMSEIFPLNIKGAAGSFATLVNWSGSWACSYTFNFLMSWSTYDSFMLYAAVNVLAVVFVIKVVPETKGRTLEQIQAAINSS